MIWSSNPPINGQDYLRRQSHVAIPFLYHNHIHNTSQHITTQHTNKTCPVCCVLLLHNIQIFPHHQTMNEPQVLQLWSKRGLEPRLRKKISLFYSYIKQPYKKTHRAIEREREDCQSNLCTDSLSSLSVFPSWFQGLLLLSAQTKIWFLSHIILSPQKSHFYLLLRKILTLSFCLNSLSPEMVHAFKVILFCFVLFHYGNFLWYSLLWGLSVCVFSLSGSKKKKILEFPMLLFCFSFSILIFLNG